MGKIVLILSWLAFTSAAVAQGIQVKKASRPGIHLVRNTPPFDSLTGTFTLRSGNDLSDAPWRFNAGDSLGWASPTYNDRHWTTAYPFGEALPKNAALWRAGRGWYRLPVRLGKKTAGKPINLIIKQFGRTDLFLDGRLVARLAPARIDSGGSQRLLQVVPLPIADTNRHLLAIRYAFRKEPTFFAELGEPPMHLSVRYAEEAITAYALSENFGVGMSFLGVGIFGTLSLLHLLFFRANRQQRLNRTLCWAMLSFAVSFLADYLTDVTPTLTLDSLVELTGKAGSRTGCALLLWGVYQYLAKQPGWFFFGILALLLIDMLHRTVIGPVPDLTEGLAFTLVFIDYGRLSWLGRKQPDARLPWRSLKLAFFCFLGIIGVIIAGVTAGRWLELSFDLLLAPVFLLFFVALMSIPVGLSLSLVQEYTRTYRLLENNLREVEQLSARTVAQEQEKQQMLARQNETLEQLVGERTAALDQSLTDLRATQAQLIQREKLASLGELTAGVAHEIQNPLNFVTNFSEVSVELLAELADEQQRPADARDPSLEGELLADIRQNMEKIGYHGQRASGIVQGMLQHSRAGTGQREPTDLNALAREYLQLAYHGLRGTGAAGKDKPAGTKLVTHLAPDLPRVSVVPQELGRVLMNLFTNALYAVQERARQETALPDAYQPTLVVTTEHTANQVQLRIHDNGTGIPEAIRDKIFQPFFTTKPTGQGTGLGLSLSYDIITKGHGGTLAVQSQTGSQSFTEFTITLPI